MDTIYIKFDTNKETKRFLNKGLEKYNFSKNEYFNSVIYKKEKKNFGFYAYDSDIIIGGAYGWIDYENWSYIDLLYIDEKFRGEDIGTKLINCVEDFAKKNNCVGMITETWSF